MADQPGSGTGAAVRDGTWKDRKVRYRADRLVVKFSPPTVSHAPDPDRLLQYVQSVVPGATCLRGPGRTGRMVIGVPANTDVLEVAGRIDSLDGIEYAEPDIVDSGVDTDPQEGGA